MENYNIQRRQSIGIRNRKIKGRRKRRSLCRLYIQLQLRFKLWLGFIRLQDRRKSTINKINYN